MARGYSRSIIVVFVVVLFLMFALAATAGYDDEFNRASDLDYYPGITNTQSAQLDINLATVIHQENLLIIQTLQSMQERLSKLEASIQKIEQEVIRK